MSAVDKLIKIAAAEVGYLEKTTNAQLDRKTANAGRNNYTKYWRDIKPDYQGQPWCAAFVTWCFVQAFGMETAIRLLKHYPYVYCPNMANLFELHANPKKGDIVIFKHGGEFTHTGIVTGVDGDYFTTIEGNTSGGSTIIANGGGVCKKGYYNSNLPGTKFCTPDWSIVTESEDDEVSKEEFDKLTDRVEKLENKVGGPNDEYNYIDKNMPSWHKEDVQWAKDRGILVGDESGNLNLSPIKLWVITVVVRSVKYLGKLINIKM